MGALDVAYHLAGIKEALWMLVFVAWALVVVVAISGFRRR